MATNRHYSITMGTLLDLTGAWKDYENFKKAVEGKQVKFDIDSKGIKQTGQEVDNLDRSLRTQDETLTGNLLTFQAANMLLSKTVDILSSMVDEVFALNAAQIEFRKVSDLSGAALDNYTQKLGKMGRQVARTSTEMVEAATEFRKNSFSDEDSATLALVATMYQNVADDAISASDSASFIIAMMKAFNVEASESVRIIDAVNEVSNSFAVSSTAISTALPKVSATLAQAGNTMEESIALLIGATEMMPGNASRVARG